MWDLWDGLVETRKQWITDLLRVGVPGCVCAKRVRSPDVRGGRRQCSSLGDGTRDPPTTEWRRRVPERGVVCHSRGVDVRPGPGKSPSSRRWVRVNKREDTLQNNLVSQTSFSHGPYNVWDLVINDFQLTHL